MKDFISSNKLEQISKILDMDQRFMMIEYRPIFAEQYAYVGQNKECWVSWSKSIENGEAALNYHPQKYAEYKYFYDFKSNDLDRVNQSIKELKSFSESELISTFFDSKKILIEKEKDKIKALSSVKKELESGLIDVQSKNELGLKAYSGHVLGSLIISLGSATLGLISLGSTIYMAFTEKERLCDNYKKGIEQSVKLISKSRIKIDMDITSNIAKSVFVYIFSGDDWKQKLEVHKKRIEVLREIIR